MTLLNQVSYLFYCGKIMGLLLSIIILLRHMQTFKIEHNVPRLFDGIEIRILKQPGYIMFYFKCLHVLKENYNT